MILSLNLSKKIVFLSLALVIFCLAGSLAHAVTVQAPTEQLRNIQALEDTLYTIHYDQEGVDSRLGRLEQTVFGQPQLGMSIDARIKKLQGVLSSNLKPLHPNSTPMAENSRTNTAPRQNNYQQPLPSQTSVSQQTPSSESDYPTVTQMEQKLFGRSYIGEDISQRLTRLEKQVFKTVQNGALADRMDNLRLVVLGDTGPSNVSTANDGTVYRYNNTMPAQPQKTYAAPGSQGRNGQRYSQIFQTNQSPQRYNAYTVPVDSGSTGYQTANSVINSPYSTMPGSISNNQNGTPATYNSSPPSDNDEYPVSNTGPYGNPNPYANGDVTTNSATTPDMINAMEEIEKEVLGTTHSSDPLRTRLDRVETKIFHTTSPEMADEERLQRVIAVAAADGANPTPQSKVKTTFQTLLPIILTILPMLLL